MDNMIKHWGEDATREVRRAQRQRDEEQAAMRPATAPPQGAGTGITPARGCTDAA